MKKLYGFFMKSAGALATLALFVATVANGSTCWYTAYQPEEPDMD